MIKRLDLNALEQPVFELTFLDSNKTTIHVMVPELELIEKLYAIAPELSAIKKSQDAKAIQKCYGFIAQLLSCNEEELTITAEELRDRYGVRFAHLVFIMRDYLEFIHSLEEAKN